MIACGNGNLRCKLPGGSKPPPYKMNEAINPNLGYSTAFSLLYIKIRRL